MKNIKREIKNISHHWVYESDINYCEVCARLILQICFSHSRNWKVVLRNVLVKNNQVRQLLKFTISSTSRTHLRNLSRPVYLMTHSYLVQKIIHFTATTCLTYEQAYAHWKILVKPLKYNCAQKIIGFDTRGYWIIWRIRNKFTE